MNSKIVTTMKNHSFFILLLAMTFAGTTSADAAEQIPASAKTFFKSHCFDCHDSSSKQGGLDLSALGSNLLETQSMATWVRIHDRVKSGEMPPEDADSIPILERRKFIETTDNALRAAHRSSKGTVLRRLNRREYENTINDIFGTNLRLADMLPPDGRSHEFENVGDALSMSMVQLRQYITVMDAVLDASIETTLKPPKPTFIKTGYTETREGEQFIGDKWLKAKDGSIVFFQNLSYPTGMLRTAGTSEPGWYRIRVTGYAYQSETPVTFSISIPSHRCLYCPTPPEIIMGTSIQS